MFGLSSGGGASAARHALSKMQPRARHERQRRAAAPLMEFCSEIPAYLRLTGRKSRYGNAAGLAPRLHFQAKLKVGAVDDPLEHEADSIADQVMRMPELEGKMQESRFDFLLQGGAAKEVPHRAAMK